MFLYHDLFSCSYFLIQFVGFTSFPVATVSLLGSHLLYLELMKNLNSSAVKRKKQKASLNPYLPCLSQSITPETGGFRQQFWRMIPEMRTCGEQAEAGRVLPAEGSFPVRPDSGETWLLGVDVTWSCGLRDIHHH